MDGNDGSMADDEIIFDELFNFYKILWENDEWYTAPEDESLVQETNLLQQRFKVADIDKNGALSTLELKGFVFPLDYPHMKNIYLQEVWSRLDIDNNKKIYEEEFLDNWFFGFDDNDDRENEKKLLFKKLNLKLKQKPEKRPFLDGKETENWIFPVNNDWAGDYARYMMEIADVDKNGLLSANEMWKRFYRFDNLAEIKKYRKEHAEFGEDNDVYWAHDEL